jgi:hypothetical protein
MAMFGKLSFTNKAVFFIFSSMSSSTNEAKLFFLPVWQNNFM